MSLAMNVFPKHGEEFFIKFNYNKGAFSWFYS